MQASVNILVATYNGEKYFDELMQSLLKQTYSNIKIFIFPLVNLVYMLYNNIGN